MVYDLAPVARHQPPGPPHEYPAVRGRDLMRRARAVEEVLGDWLYQTGSPEVRRRMLIERGLMAADAPRCS